MVYQIDSYRYWQQQLQRDDFEYGQFGENLTVDGLPDNEVCIGDRYQIGSALFEVTQPRVTCYRVGIRMANPQMSSLLVSHKRPGFYLRVLQEEEVCAGDVIVKVADGPEKVTVAEVDALLYLPGHPREQLQRALRIPALSAGWKTSLQALVAEEGTSKQGNAGLVSTSPPPSWRASGRSAWRPFNRSPRTCAPSYSNGRRRPAAVGPRWAVSGFQTPVGFTRRPHLAQLFDVRTAGLRDLSRQRKARGRPREPLLL